MTGAFVFVYNDNGVWVICVLGGGFEDEGSWRKENGEVFESCFKFEGNLCVSVHVNIFFMNTSSFYQRGFENCNVCF